MITLIVEEKPDIELKVEEAVFEKVVKDYNELSNKPTLNGETIQGAMHESDPTVPEWAKQDQKPEYSAEEIGAINKNDNVSLEDIENILNAIWG